MVKMAHTSERMIMIDLFVIAALLTIFIVRGFLALTGYPQVGNGTLHIAHMLWGGLALCGTTLYLAFAEKPNKKIAILIGGSGFGLFLDELGKFITRDNNYFFQPAAALIIGTLLLIWVGMRLWIASHEKIPFFPAASWPPNQIVSFLLITWIVLQLIIALPLFILIVAATMNGAVVDYVIPLLIALGAYTLFLLAVVTLLIRKNRQLAAKVIRMGAFFSLLAVYPISFYVDQFNAAYGFIIVILVIISTTKIYQSRSFDK